MVNRSVMVGSCEIGEMVMTPPPWKRNPIVSAVVVLASLIASRRVHPPSGSQSPSPGSAELLTVRVTAWAGLAARSSRLKATIATKRPNIRVFFLLPAGPSTLARSATVRTATFPLDRVSNDLSFIGIRPLPGRVARAKYAPRTTGHMFATQGSYPGALGWLLARAAQTYLVLGIFGLDLPESRVGDVSGRGSQPGFDPCRSVTQAARRVREWKSSLERILETWVLTVCSESVRCAAISRLVIPRAMSCAISHWRRVRAAGCAPAETFGGAETDSSRAY